MKVRAASIITANAVMKDGVDVGRRGGGFVTLPLRAIHKHG